jgi:predicted branched-subunit amino acid permease
VSGAPAAALQRSATLRQAVSVGVATGAYGVSFGALSVAAGLSVPQTMALSLLMFTGGSQFAFVGVVGAGGSGLAATATATLLGLRNGLYALQVAPMLAASARLRPLAAHLTIDESTAVGTAQPTPETRRLGFWATGLAVFTLWNLMTLVGAVVGDALGDPRRWGLDAAAAAAFLALLWPRLRAGEAQATAVGAAVVAVATTPVLPPGVPVLLAPLVAVAVWWWGDRLRRDRS